MGEGREVWDDSSSLGGNCAGVRSWGRVGVGVGVGVAVTSLPSL
jgi:hypothetical protein